MNRMFDGSMTQFASVAGFDETHLARYPREYLRGIELFNEERFWESHEEWEKLWAKSSGTNRIYFQALIQTAATLVHHQRQSEHRGLQNVWNAALEKFAQVPARYCSADVVSFVDEMKRFLDQHCSEANGCVAPGQYPKIRLIADEEFQPA